MIAKKLRPLIALIIFFQRPNVGEKFRISVRNGQTIPKLSCRMFPVLGKHGKDILGA